MVCSILATRLSDWLALEEPLTSGCFVKNAFPFHIGKKSVETSQPNLNIYFIQESLQLTLFIYNIHRLKDDIITNKYIYSSVLLTYSTETLVLEENN